MKPPTNWHETAKALSAIKPTKPKSKSGGLYDRLVSLEKQLKEKK